MAIQTKFNKSSQTFIIVLPKKFDESIFEKFKNAFEVKDKLIVPKIYQLDLSDTEEINSTGLLLILSLFHYAKERRAKVVLLHAKPQVKQFLIENQYNEIIELGEEV